MIDLKSLAIEMNHARQARIDGPGSLLRGRGADLAGQHFEPGKQRMVIMFMIRTSAEPELFGAAH